MVLVFVPASSSSPVSRRLAFHDFTLTRFCEFLGSACSSDSDKRVVQFNFSGATTARQLESCSNCPVTMVQKKRPAINADEDGPKKRRKDDVCEKPEVKKKSKKGKEYPVEVVEKRLSDDDDDDADPEEGQEDDNKVSAKSETHSALSKGANYGIGWPKEDLIELFNKIEANIPSDDKFLHTTRIEYLDWDAVAFNNYSPAECKAVWMEVHKRIRHFRLLGEIVADARVWVHTPWSHFYKGKSFKVPKHPECPRRPAGTFLLYCQAKKSKVTAQYPNLDMPQISTILAQMYNSLPKSKKAKYEKMAEVLKKEYEEKLRIFREQYPDAEREEKEARAAKRPGRNVPKVPAKSRYNYPPGLSKPKRAKMLFVLDRCEKMRNEPSYNQNEVKANAGQLWDNLSEKKKLFWIKRAADEENEFIEKVKLYASENPEYEVPAIKTVLLKDEVALLRRSKGMPNKPAPSGYVIFGRVMLQQCPELQAISPQERLREVSSKWNALSDEDREVYNRKFRNEKEQYELEMAAYLESLPEDERREYQLKSQTLTAALKPKKSGKANNGKKAKTKSKESVKKAERQYFPGEPHQPPLKAFDLFVESFVSDTKLSATEAPRFWDMLPANDKAKFQRKLAELKDKYIKDYKKFLKSLNEEEVAKYNELQKENKKIEAAAGTKDAQRSSTDDDSDEGSSSEEEDNDEKPMNDSDSDENNETEDKKSESSSDSSSNSSESSSDSSSSDDSDSSSDDSDDEDKNTRQAVVKEEQSDSDSSDDE